MFREGYEVFTRNISDIQTGKEIETEIRDTHTYQTKLVKAVFTQEKPRKKEEQVWIRALVGHLLDEKPWRIKIIKVLEER